MCHQQKGVEEYWGGIKRTGGKSLQIKLVAAGRKSDRDDDESQQSSEGGGEEKLSAKKARTIGRPARGQEMYTARNKSLQNIAMEDLGRARLNS